MYLAFFGSVMGGLLEGDIVVKGLRCGVRRWVAVLRVPGRLRPLLLLVSLRTVVIMTTVAA